MIQKLRRFAKIFLPPEIKQMIQNNVINLTSDNNDNTFDAQQKQNEEQYNKKFVDIYSFGLFMHEVITETEAKTRMNGNPKGQILNIVENKFFDFIMNGVNNEYFNEENYKIDQNGNCFIGIKEIIKKCLQKDYKNRYSSFDEIIDDIQSLPIYEMNKNEIEYRISNAPNSNNYKCTLSNLVEYMLSK